MKEVKRNETNQDKQINRKEFLFLTVSFALFFIYSSCVPFNHKCNSILDFGLCNVSNTVI
jgi:hypothetical protein